MILGLALKLLGAFESLRNNWKRRRKEKKKSSHGGGDYKFSKEKDRRDLIAFPTSK